MSAPRTLRQIAGIKPPSRLSPESSALVLIDIQQDYFTPDKLPIPDGERMLAEALRLRSWARNKGLRVVHIQQISPNPAAPIFALNSPGAAIHPALTPLADETVITKTLPSSFDRTPLDATLKSWGVTTLILAGLMTHMCVETTARGALPLGYAVIVAAQACASRDLPAASGQGLLTHQDVHQHALAALADRFADVMETDAILALVP